jgi:hypothetical protein
VSGDSSSQIAGGSGDRIYDEDIGGGIKMPASKLHTGALGADGGPVTTSNPFPVSVQGTPAVTVSGVATAAKQDTIITALGSGVAQETGGNLATAVTRLTSILAALPAALGTAGGLKAALVDLGGAATDTVVTAIRDRLPSSFGAGGGVKVDGSGTALPVSLASLPALTTGSATIGAVTGPSAAALATNAAQTDGSQKAQLVTSSGTVVSNKDAVGRLETGSGGNAYSTDDIGANGWSAVTGPCVWYGFEGDNPLSASAYLHVYDRTTAPSTGAKPAWIITTQITSGAALSGNGPAAGIQLTTGCYFAWSTTRWTFTAGTATATGVSKASIR